MRIIYVQAEWLVKVSYVFLKGVDTMSASAQNYVYMVKSRTDKPIETKPTITRKELEEMKREVNKYLVQPVDICMQLPSLL